MTAETILDVFEPPEARVAHSAALVAMTGTRDFLEDALVRFTGLKARQRAELGLTNAYLLLDAQATAVRSAVFAPHELPGLHELQPRKVAPALLHAKLALMAFARSRTGAPTDLRLVILTGNFTYTSAKHQLELLWLVDVSLDAQPAARDRADLAAAARFVETLIERRYHLVERDVPAKQRALTGRLDTLLRTCIDLEPERAKSSFIHSLDEPLYEQIRAQMKRLRPSASRNFLLCGSGFYEDPGAKPTKPTILGKLEDLGGFTGNVRRVAIAEPKMAGALAPWAKANATDGWQLVAPHDHLGHKRALHAKFIYAGWLREGVASNGCMYLGSGNLSVRGLLTSESKARHKINATGHDGVNIECGIVVEVDERLKPEDLAARLFWCESDEDATFADWETGTDPDERDHAQISASPILFARVTATTELALAWSADTDAHAHVDVRAGGDWLSVEARQPTITITPGERFDVLRVRHDAREWLVPVVDAIGRTCWAPPRFATYDDALAALLDFPIRPAEASGGDDDEGEGEGEEDGDDRGGAGATDAAHDGHAKTYALHAAASLLEQTAALQRSLAPALLDDWLEHIERFFHASFPTSLIDAWRSHKINVFAHLTKPRFRPREMSAQQGKRYDAILESVAHAWGLR